MKAFSLAEMMKFVGILLYVKVVDKGQFIEFSLFWTNLNYNR